jgi:hypothetical protein
VKPKLATFAGMLVAVLALYVLSVGQAYRTYERAKRQMREAHTPGELNEAINQAVGLYHAMDRLYAPLWWLGRHSQTFQKALDAYGALWLPPPPSSPPPP